MNILFVCSDHNLTQKDIPLPDYSTLLFGISYISAVLKLHKHKTKLLYLVNNKDNIAIICKHIHNFAPKLICFSFVATEFYFIANIANHIKKNYPEIYLLAGGPHASLCSEECISAAFDAVCLGEGEEPTLELVEQLEKGISPSGIKNLWIKQEFGIQKNPCRPFMNIEPLPFPDREMWREWITSPITRMVILLGRGCPFSCSYCCNHAMRKIAPGVYVRLRTIDSIIQEIKEIKKDFASVNEIYLEIETFGIDTNWSIKLCRKLVELNKSMKEPLSFGVNLRVTSNPNLFNLIKNLHEANFKYINIGLESGSEKIRRSILRRFESNEDIIRTVMLAKDFGIKVNFYNLIGIPGETYKDFIQTIEMNRCCLPEQTRAAIFYPYPGTDLFKLCKEWGLLVDNINPDKERQKAVIDLPAFSKKKIQKNFIWFDYHIYKGHKPTHKLLLGVLDRKMQVISDRFLLSTIYNYMKKLKSDFKRKFNKL